MTQRLEIRFKEGLADCLDRRRIALTETERVVSAMKDSVLFQRACTMAIPMLYAHWEGFAKEALQLYVEFLEEVELPLSDTEASLLAYAWTGSFRRLSGNLSHERKVELIERFLSSLTATLAFEDGEREINTKSNLHFRVLEELSACFCLDVEPMRRHQKKLDALVYRRNNIAHGGREQRLSQSDVDVYRTLVLSLMEGLESTLHDAVDNGRYRKAALAGGSAGRSVAEPV